METFNTLGKDKRLNDSSNVDIYRSLAKGQYYTDFSFLLPNTGFPNQETLGRNAVYKYNHRLYTGEYAKGKRLVGLINNQECTMPYKMLSTNFFKLTISKLISLVFSNDILIKSGDIGRDKRIAALVERTRWQEGIKKFFKLVEIYGDCPIKTYKDGVSAFAPYNGFKVVASHDKQQVLGYVIYNVIYTKTNNKVMASHIRFEIHQKGIIFERVYTYNGNNIRGTIGYPVEFEYNGRTISKEGNTYETGIEDCELVQWGTLNSEADGVYGQSSFMDIKDIVFTLEQRLSSELHIMNEHEKPLLILGAQNFRESEQTGGYELKVVNGNYLIRQDGEENPEYVTWDGKLENSKQYRDDLMSLFYELSELGKTFLSGEYSGNISEETLGNIIKSAIDRGNRDSLDVYYVVKNSLYTLCRLNGIAIKPEELTIVFSIGRTDDDKQVAEIIKTMVSADILSKQTMLEKYLGYNSEQAQAEMERIKIEKGGYQHGETD